MSGRLSTLLLLVAVLLCTMTVNEVRSDAVAEDLTGFPERPNVFRSPEELKEYRMNSKPTSGTQKVPEELKEYLRALNEYFAIAGRPRCVSSLHYQRRRSRTVMESRDTRLSRDVSRHGFPCLGLVWVSSLLSAVKRSLLWCLLFYDYDIRGTNVSTYLGSVSVSNILTESHSGLDLILNALVRLISCCLCLGKCLLSRIK